MVWYKERGKRESFALLSHICFSVFFFFCDALVRVVKFLVVRLKEIDNVNTHTHTFSPYMTSFFPPRKVFVVLRVKSRGDGYDTKGVEIKY